MQIARGPFCENAIIFADTSSPAFTVITCGVNPIPAEPRAAICTFLLLEPGGLPLLVFFTTSPEPGAPLGELPKPGGVGPPPVDAAPTGTSESAMLPSGPYFLGLPLFFFNGSVPVPVPLPVLELNAGPCAGFPCDGSVLGVVWSPLAVGEGWNKGEDVAGGAVVGVEVEMGCGCCGAGVDVMGL